MYKNTFRTGSETIFEPTPVGWFHRPTSKSNSAAVKKCLQQRGHVGKDAGKQRSQHVDVGMVVARPHLPFQPRQHHVAMNPAHLSRLHNMNPHHPAVLFKAAVSIYITKQSNLRR